MKKIITSLYLFVFILTLSCGPGVSSKKSTSNISSEKKKSTIANVKSTTNTSINKNDSVSINNPLLFKDSIAFDNGINIKWKKKGNGAKLKTGQVVLIDYLTALKDGSLVDGNRLLGISQTPYMVGFNYKTKGWDLALKELRIGDQVRINIPSELCYGKKGFGELIPPNSENIIALKVLAELNPSYIKKGIKVWKIRKADDSNTMDFDLNTQLGFHFFASTANTKNIINTYKNNSLNRINYNDLSNNNLFKFSLKNVKAGQQLYIVASPYFSDHLGDFSIKNHSNEQVFFNVDVISIEASK